MKKKNTGKLKNDVIFITSLLVILAIVCCPILFREEGDTVMIKTGGEIFGEYSLHEDQTIEIRSDKTLNVIIIREGKVWMENASCPDGICTAHRAIFRDGESIICLPNRVLITVISEKEEAPDITV